MSHGIAASPCSRQGLRGNHLYNNIYIYIYIYNNNIYIYNNDNDNNKPLLGFGVSSGEFWDNYNESRQSLRSDVAVFSHQASHSLRAIRNTIYQFELFEFILSVKLDTRFPVEQFEASRAIRADGTSVSSTLPPLLVYNIIVYYILVYSSMFTLFYYIIL